MKVEGLGMLVRKSKYNTTRGSYDFPGRRICFFKYKRKNNFKLKSVLCKAELQTENWGEISWSVEI